MKDADLKSQLPEIKSFQTRDRESASEFMTAVLGREAELDFFGKPDAFSLKFDGTNLESAVLGRFNTTNSRFRRRIGDEVHVLVPLKGQQKLITAGEPHDLVVDHIAGVGRPGEQFDVEHVRAAGIILVLPMERILARVEQLTGASPGDLRSEDSASSIDAATPVGEALVRNLKAVFAEMTKLESSGIGNLARLGYKDLFLNLVAAAVFPSVMRTLERPQADCGSAAIRNARDYIREHAAEHVDMARLATDLGISMRAMQENFRRYFKVSPRDYLMECRLELARDLLSLTDNVSSVTDIAIATGFSDLSHFARKYRERYSVLPSETLRLARR